MTLTASCIVACGNKGEGHRTSDTRKKLVEAERTDVEKVNVLVMKQILSVRPGLQIILIVFFHCNLWV